MSAAAAGGGFVTGNLLPAAAFLLVYFAGSAIPKARSAVWDDTLMVMYLASAYAVAGAVAYALIACAARTWRERPLKQQFLVSMVIGVAAQLLNWTGLSLVLLLPFMHLLPRQAATVLGIAMPGVVCGVAVLAWSLARTARRPVPPAAGRD